MKKLQQIMKGVTAGGQWSADGPSIVQEGEAGRQTIHTIGSFRTDCGQPYGIPNAAYTARAARNFPALVKALEEIERDSVVGDPSRLGRINRTAWSALAEALKDGL